MKVVNIGDYFSEEMAYQDNILPIYQKKFCDEVYYITSDREAKYEQNSEKRIVGAYKKKYKGINLIRLEIYFESINRFVVLKGLYKELEKIKPDIIFHHGMSSPSLLTCLKYKKKNKNVILNCDNHADFNNSLNHMFSRLYHKAIWKNIIQVNKKYFNNLFGVSPESKKFIEEIYNIKKAKFLPLGGEMLEIENEKKDIIRKEIRTIYDIKDDEFLLIHAGKMDELKKTVECLEVLEEIDNKKIKIMLAGSVNIEYEKKLMKFLNKNNVIKMGWVSPETLNKLFIASDLMIQPGSLSVIFQQGICMGLPVILDKTEMGKFLVQNNNGKLVENSKELKEAIIELYEKRNSELLNMKRCAIEFASKNIDYKVIASKSIEQ